MLHDHDGRSLRWSARCDRCLVPSALIEASRSDALAQLVAEGWELRPREVLWCIDCARRAREVPFPRTRRGVRRRR